MLSRRLLIIIIVLASLFAMVSATSAQSYCPGAPLTRLAAGQQGRVTPGLPNTLRSQPWSGAGSAVLGYIPAGGVFTVLEGYAAQCNQGMIWFFVSYNGLAGWTPEGQNGVYWLEPVSTVPNTCSYLQPRLSIGAQGRVTPGLPNVIRAEPRRGSGSPILGYIPGGGVFTVLDGPRCSDNITWWYVNYNGNFGWTGEGQGTTYWTEPTSNPGLCDSGLPSRLSAGMTGRVTPGLPNTLRETPSTFSRRLGQIPAGGTFAVISGPTCGQGIIWWLVQYNGIIGYTGEARYGEYWLEPVY